MASFQLLPRCRGLFEGEVCDEPASAVVREQNHREHVCAAHFAKWLDQMKLAS